MLKLTYVALSVSFSKQVYFYKPFSISLYLLWSWKVIVLLVFFKWKFLVDNTDSFLVQSSPSNTARHNKHSKYIAPSPFNPVIMVKQCKRKKQHFFRKRYSWEILPKSVAQMTCNTLGVIWRLTQRWWHTMSSEF